MDPGNVIIRKGTTYVFPESACMLALDQTGAIILVEQFRRPKSETTLELPGGVVQPGETPEISARREFEEETGLMVANARFLFSLDLDLSTTVHRTHVFSSIVQRIIPKKRSPEFEVRRLLLGEALDLIRSGSITHAPTVAGVLSISAEY